MSERLRSFDKTYNLWVKQITFLMKTCQAPPSLSYLGYNNTLSNLLHSFHQQLSLKNYNLVNQLKSLVKNLKYENWHSGSLQFVTVWHRQDPYTWIRIYSINIQRVYDILNKVYEALFIPSPWISFVGKHYSTKAGIAA